MGVRCYFSPGPCFFTDEVKTQGSSTINEIPISQIEANPNQPRRDFDQEALQELAQSIKEIGIVSPITLRQISENRFQIIAGERRWRASQIVGLQAIPAYIRTTNDENVMEMALVENIQREDLNAIEIALAYQHLLENTGMTQEKVAERVGKSRTAVTNHLRLLKLPAQVQMALQKKEIDMGHARALLAIDSPSQQLRVFRDIQKNGYSVRQVETLVKKINEGEEDGEKRPAKKQPNHTFRQRERTGTHHGCVRETEIKNGRENTAEPYNKDCGSGIRCHCGIRHRCRGTGGDRQHVHLQLQSRMECSRR